MSTGYVALFDTNGDGLGIASAKTIVDLQNRSLTLGTGSVTATNLIGSSAINVVETLVVQGNANGAGSPVSANSTYGLSVALNWTGSDSGVTFFNTCRLASLAFRFLQCTGASTTTSIMDLNSNGSVLMYAGLSVSGSVTTRSNANHGLILGNSSGSERASFAYASAGGAWSASAAVDDHVVRALSGKLILQTGSGAAGVIIDSSNNVGIGTSTINARLQLSGGGMAIDGGLVQGSARPAISTAVGAYEIRGHSSTSFASNNGFLRLSSGGGTLTSFQSSIDLSGASSDSDMNQNIVMRTVGTERLRIDYTGKVNFNIGLSLPTSGGTASTLDHYEETTFTLTFSNVWAANQSLTGRMIRAGKVATLIIPSLAAVATTGARVDLTAGTALAVRFRPVIGVTFVVRCLSNSASVVGVLVIGTDGLMQIYASIAGGFFASTGNAGWDPMIVTYHVA